MQTIDDGYNYLKDAGDRVVLTGLDPDKLLIVPIGVGIIDDERGEVLSQGKVDLKLLDFIGYAFVDKELQPVLQRYANGEIDLNQLKNELHSNE